MSVMKSQSTGYLVKYNDKYLEVSMGGMGGWNYDFVDLDYGTLLNRWDADRYAEQLNVLDDKNGNVKVDPKIVKVKRTVEIHTTTEVVKKKKKVQETT